MKTVRVIKQDGEWDNETHFTSDTFPMAIHFAESWAKRNGYKLVKSAKKIAELFACHQVACNRDEKVFYVSERGNASIAVALLITGIVVYGMYLVANPSGQDIFTWFWSFVASL